MWGKGAFAIFRNWLKLTTSRLVVEPTGKIANANNEPECSHMLDVPHVNQMRTGPYRLVLPAGAPAARALKVNGTYFGLMTSKSRA